MIILIPSFFTGVLHTPSYLLHLLLGGVEVGDREEPTLVKHFNRLKRIGTRRPTEEMGYRVGEVRRDDLQVYNWVI